MRLSGLPGICGLGRLIVLWDDNKHHHRRRDRFVDQRRCRGTLCSQRVACRPAATGMILRISAVRLILRWPIPARRLIACRTIIGYRRADQARARLRPMDRPARRRPRAAAAREALHWSDARTFRNPCRHCGRRGRAIGAKGRAKVLKRNGIQRLANSRRAGGSVRPADDRRGHTRPECLQSDYLDGLRSPMTSRPLPPARHRRTCADRADR